MLTYCAQYTVKTVSGILLKHCFCCYFYHKNASGKTVPPIQAHLQQKLTSLFQIDMGLLHAFRTKTRIREDTVGAYSVHYAVHCG